MLSIYSVMLSVLSDLRPFFSAIASHDRSLEDQMRRASTSVLLNIAEAGGSRGKTRTLRYCTALGSARETRACLHVATALGYIGDIDAALLDRLERVIATLVNLVRTK